MKYKLQDLIDMKNFQNLQDRLNEIYSFPSAIIDNDGNILTATAWQDICVKFHRKNTDALKHCIKSDQYILSHLNEANPAVTYLCPYGMVDNATPIIIDGIHYGNFFTGQFFLEKPDMEFFKSQATKYGFDEESYLEAVKKVPIWSQEQLTSYLYFIKGLITVISESGLEKLKEIEVRKQIEENQEAQRAILQTAMDGFWLADIQGRLLEVNDAYCRMSGYSEKELLTMNISDLEVFEKDIDTDKHIKKIMAQGEDRFETRHRRKDGSIFDIEISVQYRPTQEKPLIAFLRDITGRRQTELALHKSELRYQTLFEHSPISVWEEDFSEFKAYIESFKSKVTHNWRNFFESHPEQVANCAAMIKVLAINETSVKFFEAEHKDDIPKNLPVYFTAESMEVFKEELIALAEGKTRFECEIPIRTTKGDTKLLYLTLSIVPGCEQTLARVLVTFIDITGRMRAEEALRESETKYRSLVDNANEAIIVAQDGLLKFVNRKTSELTGYSEQELLTKPFHEFIHPDDRDLVTQTYKKRIKNEPVPSKYIFRLLTKDGVCRWVEISAIMIEWNGKPSTLNFISDVSERILAENALKESEKNYRTFVDMAEEGIWAMDGAKLTTFVNRRMAVMLGRSPEDMIGKIVEDFMFPEELPAHRERMKNRAKGDMGKYEQRFRCKNGSEVWCLVSATPLINEDGSFNGSFAMFTDITERKQAEEALRNLSYRQQALLSAIPDIITEVDKNKVYTWANSTALAFFGNDMIGKKASFYFEGEQDTYNTVKPLFEGNEDVIYVESWQRRKDGEKRLLAWNCRGIKDKDENFIGTLSSAQDITDRKLSEMKLENERILLKTILDNIPVAVYAKDKDGRKVLANSADLNNFNKPEDEIIGHTDMDLYPENVAELTMADDFAVIRNGEQLINREEFIVNNAGERRWLLTSKVPWRNIDGEIVGLVGIGHDITDRKQAEEAYELTARLIVMINTPGDFHELMSNLTTLLQSWSGCEAVGIRLREGDDFPYYETRGFPSEFVQLEKYLCAYDPDGNILRDGTGNPVLECMCGNILSGRFDPTKPFFTPHGSFWSNNTTNLLARTTDADRQARTRNRCNGEGYESVALIPLRSGQHVFGLLQFNDTRTDRFTPGLITHFEILAESLAIALLNRQAQEAQRRSEENLAEAQRIAHIGSWEWDFSTNTIKLSKEMYKVYGLNPETYDGKPESLINVIHPADFEIFNVSMNNNLSSGNSPSLEYRVIHEDGSIHNISAEGRIEFDEAGNPIRGIGTVQDITERKRAEEKLLRANDRLALAQRSANAGIWDWDITTGQLNWTPEHFRLFGLDTEATPSFDLWRSVIHPDDLQMAEERIKTSIKEHTPLFNEYRIVRPSGEVRWINAMGDTLYDEHGEAKRMSGICIDITEHKKVGEALHESEEKYRLLFEASPVGIGLADTNGIIIDANKVMLEMMGYSLEDIKNISLSDVYNHPEDRKKVLQILYQEKKVREFELELKQKNGNVFNALINIDLINIGNTEVLLTTTRDITERKQIEEAQLFMVNCGCRGDDFFESLARWLAEKLSMDYVCIDRLEPNGLEATTLSIYFDNSFEDNVTYTLKDTPCGKVVGQTVCCFPQGVRHLFPKDIILQEMVAESYIGTTLWSSQGEPIGLIAVIGRQPLENPRLAETILKLASVRAAGELERKRAESALRESEIRFSSAFEFAAIGMALVSPEGTFLKVNKALCNLLEYSAEELMSMSFQDITHIDDLEKDLDYVHQLLHGEINTYQMSKRYIGKHGNIVWVLLSVSLVRDVQKRPQYFISQIHDITDRKQAEDALKLSDELFSLFMHHSPIYTYIKEVTPTESRVLQASENFTDLIGLPGSKISGKTMEELFPPDFAAKITEEDWSVVTRGEVLRLDEELNGRNYTTIKFPILQGDKTLLAGYTIDITERTLAEEALHKSESRFREIVEQSTDVFYRQNIKTNRFEYVSPKSKYVLGYTPDEMLALTYEEQIAAIHPDDLPNLKSFSADLIEADNKKRKTS